ncbi:hypothetical protein G7070_06990 [Propioniciclava coleopterorum]|uniref:Uncharacterized protein n=1 Tax=Propioniciclava coleopterorum TaxID=2714937 RepID=A0A6G7Y5R7_9ACTN|nr:hypothetical protein [Propioniciclava coleopterorum]QIK72059.1 hypothetical protein G7070_06990 [Propioniciclava coleopterorum]
MVSPLASHDVLRTIIERDGAGQSATTYALTEASAKVLLRREAQVFSDALLYGAAAEVGVDRLAQYRSAAELMVPGITDQLSCDRLQGSLAVLQLSGQDPLACLEDAAHARPIGDARDRAAVVEWRLTLGAAGPLPWLSGPPRL